MPGVADIAIAVDTSVAVPLAVAGHVAHGAVVEWRGQRRLRLCGHALIEVYSVLTRLPARVQVDPADVVRLLGAEFDPPLLLSVAGQKSVPATLAASGVVGGATYDGLVALTAREHRAVLVSRDARAQATYSRLGVQVEMLTDGR